MSNFINLDAFQFTSTDSLIQFLQGLLNESREIIFQTASSPEIFIQKIENIGFSASVIKRGDTNWEIAVRKESKKTFHTCCGICED